MIITGAIDFRGEHIKMSVSQHKGIGGLSSNNTGYASSKKDGQSQKYGSITGILVETEGGKSTEAGKKKRIASPDLWEYTRLKGGNVLNLIDDENLDQMQNGAADDEDMAEEEAEIELNDEEPPFLQG